MHKLDTLTSKIGGFEVALAIAGARLINNISHVTCGVKIINVRGRSIRKNSLVIDFQRRDNYHVLNRIL